MVKQMMVVVASMAILGGCGGGSTTTVSGAVADGYLSGATVFVDRNGNYRWDEGEPRTTTGSGGRYALNVAASDIGRYPVVALAVKNVTIDEDTGLPVPDTYLLSLPAGAVSGEVAAFISPMSTLVREKLAANPGMSMTEAVIELRNQLNLAADTDVMGDYVRLAAIAAPGQDDYRLMHNVARNMADLMTEQAGEVVNAGRVPTTDVNRYRAMVGTLNTQLPAMVEEMLQRNSGIPVGGTPFQNMSSFRTSMATAMSERIATTPAAGGGSGYQNMSTLFPTRAGVRFWNNTGHLIYRGTMGR